MRRPEGNVRWKTPIDFHGAAHPSDRFFLVAKVEFRQTGEQTPQVGSVISRTEAQRLPPARELRSPQVGRAESCHRQFERSRRAMLAHAVGNAVTRAFRDDAGAPPQGDGRLGCVTAGESDEAKVVPLKGKR
jgi:hypothetical protein